jgi:hypothetical protein
VPTIEDDYIIRMIRMFAQVIARIIGLRTSGQFDEARVQLDLAYQTLSGGISDLFSQMDSETGARLLADPEKMAVMAELLHEEAELARAGKNGDPETLDRRALEYALEAFRMDPEDGSVRSLARELSVHVDAGTLDQRYRDALERFSIESQGAV